MSRKSLIRGLVELCAEVPWWIALCIGAVLYVLCVHVLPVVSPESVEAALRPALRILGYVFAGACALGIAVGFFQRRRQRRLYDQQTSIESVRALSWRDFEQLITEAFRRDGYTAQTTASGPDGGVDIVLRKGGKTYLVQCKHWRNRRVGVAPIRELAGVIASAKASGGYFVCSGAFTDEAKAFARKAAITLIDGRVLAAKLGLAKSEVPRASVGPTTFCPRCGSVLVVRTAERGDRAGQDFLGCSKFPSCRYTKNLA